jgi:hypothetical protein
MMQASWCIELPYKRYISGTTANDFNSYSRILRKKEMTKGIRLAAAHWVWASQWAADGA